MNLTLSRLWDDLGKGTGLHPMAQSIECQISPRWNHHDEPLEALLVLAGGMSPLSILRVARLYAQANRTAGLRSSNLSTLKPRIWASVAARTAGSGGLARYAWGTDC